MIQAKNDSVVEQYYLLNDRYQNYVTECSALRQRLNRAQTPKGTRVYRLNDLNRRLIPALQLQLAALGTEVCLL